MDQNISQEVFPMAQTKFWICDVCGQPIRRPEDGWVEWIVHSHGGKTGRDLRLVHHRPASPMPGGCQFNGRREHKRDGGSLGDFPLTEFIGPSGLMRLLAFIANETVPIEETLEMIKRLHVPGYEHVRFHLRAATSAGVFDPIFGPGIIVEPQIDDVLEWLKENEELA